MNQLRMSPDEYEALLAKRATQGPAKKTAPAGAPAVAPSGQAGIKAWQALGRLPKGVLNKTEQAFAELLDRWKVEGKVLWWKAHPFNIPLAKNTFYRADFLALMADGMLTIFETKGTYTSEKGQAKIKLAAAALPVIRMVKAEQQSANDGGHFKLTEFEP